VHILLHSECCVLLDLVTFDSRRLLEALRQVCEPTSRFCRLIPGTPSLKPNSSRVAPRPRTSRYRPWVCRDAYYQLLILEVTFSLTPTSSTSTNIMATEDTVQLNEAHAPQQASIDAFSSIIESVKAELLKLRRDHDSTTRNKSTFFSSL
jgi:hypothetical protein